MLPTCNPGSLYNASSHREFRFFRQHPGSILDPGRQSSKLIELSVIEHDLLHVVAGEIAQPDLPLIGGWIQVDAHKMRPERGWGGACNRVFICCLNLLITLAAQHTMMSCLSRQRDHRHSLLLIAPTSSTLCFSIKLKTLLLLKSLTTLLGRSRPSFNNDKKCTAHTQAQG